MVGHSGGSPARTPALQVRPTPPLPALRLALLVTLFALATVPLVDAMGRAAGWLQQRRQRARQGGVPGCNEDEQQPAADPSSQTDEEAPASSKPGEAAEPVECCNIAADSSSSARHPAQPLPILADGATSTAADAPQQPQAQPSFGRADSFLERRPGAPLQPRPEMVLARGLSRRVRKVAEGRPRLVRAGALALITVSFSTASISQVIAPGFIDPALGEETPTAACRCCLCRPCHLLLHPCRCGWLPPPALSLHT